MELFKNALHKKFYWLLAILITIPTFFTLLKPGYFWMQDDLQAFRVHQMDKCIQDLQIPCRWVPDAGYQYGYPEFNYYPPSIYYLGESFHLAGFQFTDSVKILFILGFISSALFMYLFLRRLLGEWPALVGAALYTYVPYRAVEVYVRGAMSEFWSLSIFPLIFWFSYELIKTKKIKYIGWLAISIGLLLTTHNLMSLIFFPIAASFILTWIILEKDLKILPKLFMAVILGVGLGAFFTLPVFFERPFVHLETLLGGYFDYRAHFVDIKRLLLSNDWGYGSSNIDPKNELNLSTGVVHFILGILAMLLALISFKKYRNLAILTFVMFTVELLVLFMIHQKSSFIWSLFDFLAYLQFPWRFLSASIFLLSLLGALAVFFIGKLNLKWVFSRSSVIVGITLIMLVFILHGSFFKSKEWYFISDQDKFSGKSWEKQLTISIFDYLPIYAKFPPIKKAPDFPEVLKGDVIIQSYQKRSDFQEGEVEVKKAARLRLPLFDFPGMKVVANGQEIKHINNDCSYEEFCLGLISFDLPPGKYIIKTQLTDTPIRLVGNFLTILSILIVAYLLIRYRDHEKDFS